MGGAYVGHGETGNIWEVNLKKTEVIWNKYTQLIGFWSLQMIRTEIW
jgi:hypothetical protein